MTIVTESLVFHRLSEQQSKRWDGFYDLLIVMNKTEKSKESNGTSERRSYLYIILKTRKKKSLSHFLTGGNNWRSNAQAHPNTQLIMKKNENVIFFLRRTIIVDGDRWSQMELFYWCKERERATKCVCTADAKNDDWKWADMHTFQLSLNCYCCLSKT